MKTTECINDENSWIHGAGGGISDDDMPIGEKSMVDGGSNSIVILRKT